MCWGEGISVGGILEGVVWGCCVCERYLCVCICVFTYVVCVFQLSGGVKVTKNVCAEGSLRVQLWESGCGRVWLCL